MDVSEGQDSECYVSVDVEPIKCEDKRHALSGLDKVVEPYLGMEFESEEDARSFYNEYARHLGFTVRLSSTRLSKRDYTRYARLFVCSRYGLRGNKNGQTRHDVRETRTDCKAMIMVKKKENGKWFLHKFHANHNHELISPSMTQFLRSQKKISNCQKSLNYFAGDRRSRIEIGDAQAIVKHFEDMQAKDPLFFYQIELDKEARLFNVFWADAKSRSAYNHFGDVVIFDTTYLTDKYRMPFVPIVGVNNHMQSILFGCALLGDESKESFIWLLNTFLKAMFGHLPVSIITDQDRAMKAAIVEVFPRSCHRFFMWHIKRNFLEKLSHACHIHPNFQLEFEKCVEESETGDEFEARWDLLLAKFELIDNRWLQDLYEDRWHWVPVYFEPRFFAGMSTTKRNESMRAFFDGYVNAKTSLQEFIGQYEKTLVSRYDEELRADLETINNPSKIRTKSPLEKHAAGIYTYEVFKKFQEEMDNSLGYFVGEVEKNDENAKYRVIQYDGDKKAYTIMFNANETRAICSCKMFEDEGILCRHILLIFVVANISAIPSHYILDRWTRKARYKVVHNESNDAMQSNRRDSHLLRFNDMCRQYLKIAEIGSRSIQNYDIVMQILHEVFSKLDLVEKGVTKLPHTNTQSSGRDCEDNFMELSEAYNTEGQLFVCSPNVSNSKGRPPSKRLGPPYAMLGLACQRKKPLAMKDLERSRTRTCSTCGHRGHDMRTCKRHQQGIQMERLDQAESFFPGQSSTRDNFVNI